MTNDELEADMQNQGYRFGGINEIDIQVCADNDCESCGHHGTKLSGWVKDGSYRAFAVCPKCDDAIEF